MDAVDLVGLDDHQADAVDLVGLDDHQADAIEGEPVLGLKVGLLPRPCCTSQLALHCLVD